MDPRGMYTRLSGINADQQLDDELESLLSLPNINPNQPREWLDVDAQGRTSYALVSFIVFNWILSGIACARKVCMQT